MIFRPNAKGDLEITPDEEPYDYKLPPNRGIPPQAAVARLESVKNWIEKGERAPTPEWQA